MEIRPCTYHKLYLQATILACSRSSSNPHKTLIRWKLVSARPYCGGTPCCLHISQLDVGFLTTNGVLHVTLTLLLFRCMHQTTSGMGEECLSQTDSAGRDTAGVSLLFRELSTSQGCRYPSPSELLGFRSSAHQKLQPHRKPNAWTCLFNISLY